MKFEFGDLVEDTSAGEKNPHRIGMFIGKAWGFVHVLCRDGNITKYDVAYNDKEGFLQVAGAVDLTGWDKAMAEQWGRETKNEQD